MDVVQFQEKLREICELGKQNRNMLTHEQIRGAFLQVLILRPVRC